MGGGCFIRIRLACTHLVVRGGELPRLVPEVKHVALVGEVALVPEPRPTSGTSANSRAPRFRGRWETMSYVCHAEMVAGFRFTLKIVPPRSDKLACI